jgi:hypothetical protein
MSGDRSTYPSYDASNEAVILQQVRDKEAIDNANEAHISHRKRPRVDSGGAQGQIAGTGLSLVDSSTNQFSQSVAGGKICHFTFLRMCLENCLLI